MRLFSNIDNGFVLKYKISLQEAVLLEWLMGFSRIAKKATIDGKIYFFASKNKAVSDIPTITDKVDTMYRYYKKLEDKGFIKLAKVDGNDYVFLNKKCDEWNSSNYADIPQSDHSDNLPNELGQSSENNSDNFPTYSNNIIHSNNNNSNVEIDLFNNPLKDKKNKKEKPTKEKVLMPFDSENFIQQWQVWKDYKLKEHRFRYKSTTSEQAALKKLSELSHGIEHNAIKIIHESISNGWKGFFELKINNDGKKQALNELGSIAINWKRNNAS